MANESTTIAQAETMIKQRITSNNAKQITGQVLQEVLLGVTSGVKNKTNENAMNFRESINELRREMDSNFDNITPIDNWEIGELFPKNQQE